MVLVCRGGKPWRVGAAGFGVDVLGFGGCGRGEVGCPVGACPLWGAGFPENAAVRRVRGELVDLARAGKHAPFEGRPRRGQGICPRPFSVAGRAANLSVDSAGGLPSASTKHLKGLILAQNERWWRGLGMQVVREGGFGHRRAANGVVRRRNVPKGPG